MGSEIWCVRSEKVGSLEAFSSERDMESFLINNPAIVGCWDPDVSSSIPALIREQISTVTGKLERGRIDLVGIARTDDGYELRIFELKSVEISESAVDQLSSYLNGWEAQKSGKEKIAKWIVNLDLNGMDESKIEDIIKKPKGVLVGPKFSPEASVKAKSLRIRAIRLARFKAASSAEYYVIVEDEVGDIVGVSRRSWSWKNLAGMGMITPDDYFVIRHENSFLRAKPDTSTWDWSKKKVVFDDESTRLLLEKEDLIRSKANNNDKKWLEKELASLKSGTGVYLSNATGLSYLALGGPTAVYWIPNWWWVHEKSGQHLESLVNAYMSRS